MDKGPELASLPAGKTTNIGALHVSVAVDSGDALAALNEVTEAVERLSAALERLHERGSVRIRVGDGVKLYRDYAKDKGGEVREVGIAAVRQSPPMVHTDTPPPADE